MYVSDAEREETMKNDSKSIVRVSDEIREAVENGKPVVALESTIISHGMPYPQNVEMAATVQRVIRENGAIPATICILDGEVVVGATPDEIRFFGIAGTEDQKGLQTRFGGIAIAQGAGRDNRHHNHDRRRACGHSRFCHGRNRRSTSGRRANHGYFSGFGGTCTNGRAGGLCRLKVNSGFGADA